MTADVIFPCHETARLTRRDEITKPCFDYQGHIAILKAAGEQNLSGDKKDGWHELGYFPREINAEIEKGYKTVLAHIENYSSAGDEIIDELIR